MVLGRLPFYGEPEVSPDRSQASSLSAEELVVAYHERTKHHYHRFAASAGYMDWATQPDPFRRYDGASLVRLLFPEMGQALPYWQLYVADSMEPAPLSIDSVSLFFRYALSLTAWKRFHETTWSLRANPSSGNLHPTEGYAVLPAIERLADAPAVYHYAPKEHALERRAILDAKAWNAPFSEGSFLVGLSSQHWRKMVRQCQHAEPRAQRRVARDRRGDAGHATIRKRAGHGRLLRVPHAGGALRDPCPPGPTHRGEGNPRPPKRGSDGWLDGNLAGSVLPHARSVDTDARRALDALGCDPLAASHPSRTLRPPRRRRPSGPLRARSRSRQARVPQESDATGVSLAAPALLSAGAPAVPAPGRGLSGARGHRLLRAGHRRRRSFQPGDDRGLHGQL